MADFNPTDFRRALGSFATGVTIITSRDNAGAPVGLTANSFNSVSLNPPLVLWSLAKSSNCLPAFERAEHFAIHLLAASQQSLSDRFATRGVDKFAGMSVEEGIGGIPLLANCAARFQCRKALQYDGGDHVILVGEVVQFDKFDVAPLVYYGGSYAVATRRPHHASWQAVRTQREGSFSEDSLHYLVGLLNLQLTHHVVPVVRDLGCEDLAQFHCLMLLGLGDGRTLAELNQTLPRAATPFTDDARRALAAAGFVRSDDDARLWLTPSGQDVLVHGIAAAKGKESDALDCLDEAEQVALRHLLKRLIVQTDISQPAPAQKSATPRCAVG